MTTAIPLSFDWPVLLWLFLLLPVLMLLYFRSMAQRRKLAESLVNSGWPGQLQASRPGLRKYLPFLFYLLGLLVLTLALARPHMQVSLPSIEQTILLVFDVSGSMAATDVAPTRMEAAKALAKAFVNGQPLTTQIGVVAFSESGFSVQPPSNDHASILASINRIEPQRGTSLASGIQVALDAIARHFGEVPEQSGDFAPELLPSPTPFPKDSYSSAAIILFSDGENNINPDPLAAAHAAADRGVRIYTVGIGSLNGTSLKVNGFVVHTQLDEEMLKQISALSEGAYLNGASFDTQDAITANIKPQLVVQTTRTEVTALFSAAGFVLFLIGGLFSLLWFGHIP